MDNEKLIYHAIVTKFQNDEYVAHYSSSGIDVFESGSTLSEAIAKLQSILEFTLYNMIEDGKQLPPTTDEEKLSYLEANKKANEYVITVSTDVAAIHKNFGKTSIKKTISIPQYMDTWIEKNNISLSKYLQSKIEQDIITY